MKPLGVFRLYVTHKQQTWKLQFEIVTTRVARRPLLSANTCERLALISIHNTEQQKTPILQTAMQEKKTDHEIVNFNKNEMDKLLKDYTDVFEGLGRLPGKPLNLYNTHQEKCRLQQKRNSGRKSSQWRKLVSLKGWTLPQTGCPLWWQ